ncbi:protein-glutamate O-methyltransferase CheR [Shouchella sp. JSM 1781072]|uniref:CheR family methyltransferase n=1 Tax=Shouchella sp. JSM 1781072 TaxID=3344581 RepID=UPI0035C124CF
MHANDDYLVFSTIFEELTGIQLNAYKRSQMERRLRSLSVKHKMPDMAMFGQAVKERPDLLRECKEKMTINVTSFFRNADRWETFVHLLQSHYKQHNQPLRIWSSACSSGEEAYTVAMLCKSNNLPLENQRLFASDLDESIIAKAKNGVYSFQTTPPFDQQLHSEYVSKKSDGFHVSNELKNRVSFSIIDLIHDDYPEQMDVIICRNVCIYFTEETKQVIFRKLSNALRQGGLLFVGSTEQIFHPHTYGLTAVAPFFYKKSI